MRNLFLIQILLIGAAFSLPLQNAPRPPTFPQRLKRSPFNPSDKDFFDADSKRTSSFFGPMQTSESRPKPDNVDRILSIFGGALLAGPQYPRQPPHHKWRPMMHPRPHLGLKHPRPHHPRFPHKPIFKPNSGPPKHHGPPPIHHHEPSHPHSLEEVHHHHFDEIHDAGDHDSLNAIHDHPHEEHIFKPSPHEEHFGPVIHEEPHHEDYHDEHHVQFDENLHHGDVHSFEDKPLAFGHMFHDMGHDGFSPEHGAEHGGHVEFLHDDEHHGGGAHGFSDFGHEFLHDEGHDPHNIISHDSEPPKLSHHPGYIKGITKNNIYRDDVPFKEVTNENDKIHPGLVPGGVKGLNPELISFISDKTRPYVYGHA